MLLQVKHIKKYYGTGESRTMALQDVSFDVEKGDFISIMGASGSGKTTLLNCLSTIDTASSGEVILDGRDITKLPDKDVATFRRENLGFIFQDSNLLDTLTMEENIALPLTIKQISSDDVDRRTKEIAEKLGISETMKKFPYQVSGGQKQRCAAARAVVGNPKLVLADEPTGALDSKSAKTLMELLSKLNKTLNTTILLVTHDPLAASYAKRILFLQDGKIFHELQRGAKTNQDFYHNILRVLSEMGGENSLC